MSRPRGRPSTSTSALVPAAARSEALGDVEAVLNEEAIEVFAKAVGGRAQLADVLAIAGRGSEVERITTLLLDPRYASWKLSRLCSMVGLTVADLFASYRKAMIARAHIEATHLIARKLPPVVDDVMTRAAPQRVVCPRCLGTSAVGQGPCSLCHDTGAIQSEPDLDRQKLALELGQLLEKKGGLIVQQNNTMAASLGGTAPGALEQLQQAVGDLLFGERRPAEIIDADPPTSPRPGDVEDDEDEDEEDDEDDQPEVPIEQPDSPLSTPPEPSPEQP